MPGREFLAKIEAVLAPWQIVTNSLELEEYRLSPRDFYQAAITAVLLPETTQQVSAIMQLAYQTKTGIIPQGGNTGLVGGQQGVANQQNIILSLRRMQKIIAIDAKNFTVLLEAGVILENLHQAVEQKGLCFPLQLASQASCQIGGNLAVNAGGTAVLAYGSMRDLCLGLEIVLPDGRILNDLRFVKKDNSGFDVKNLFIGSEGTLGIITKAVLKLWPKPKMHYVAYVACESLDRALDFFTLAKQSFGAQLSGYELLSQFALQLSLRYMPKSATPPLKILTPWYVLLDISCFSLFDHSAERLEMLLQEAMAAGLIKDGVVAQNRAQEKYFWQLRENLSAAQKAEGVSIKNDISLPINHIGEFLSRAADLLAQYCPQARIVCFGHVGDGNLHYNILVPQSYDKRQEVEFLNLWQPISEALNQIVISLDGSIAAEHGIGQLKRAALQKFKDPVAYALMLSLKQQLDPYNIMNPHKVLNM